MVDLEDVTWVDDQGEKLLLKIITEGAQVIVNRAYMRYVVENLNVRQP